MSGIYTRLVSGLLFPLHERLKGHASVAVRKEMERTQWYSPQEMQAYQLRRLRAFLQQAGERVPYYRDLFEQAGFSPKDMNSIDELARLPCLSKGLIRENTERLKAEGHAPLSRFNTGGSSGEPLIFYLGKERVSHDVAAKWRATRWWGVDIGDPEIVVWGSPIELGSQDRIRLIRDKLLRTHLLPAFEMSKENLGNFVDEIRRIRPRMLFGYPSSIAMIAGHAEGSGIDMTDLCIRVAFVTSEKLYDDQRERIERVFACPVANGYGGRDAGFIAHQCPEGGMHITAEDIVVEIVDADGSPVETGQAGEVVVTHMATSDFPFIRYRTGDVAVLDDEPCRCGRGLPLLREIQGRTTDFIVREDGTVMHGLALIYVLRDLAGIDSFQIVQESVGVLRILIVRNAEFTSRTEEEIIHGMRARLGEDTKVKLEFVDRINPEGSGKYRYVKSLVSV